MAAVAAAAATEAAAVVGTIRLPEGLRRHPREAVVGAHQVQHHGGTPLKSVNYFSLIDNNESACLMALSFVAVFNIRGTGSFYV
jgi:hypothetical protein